MARVSLKVLTGLFLFCAIVYLLLNTNVLSIVEGDNPDGSSSLTWHSAVFAILLAAISQLISFWAFRKRIALTLLGGVAASIATWRWLGSSSLAFAWEPHGPEGTFPLTWRSDLVVFAFLLTFLTLSLLLRWTISSFKRH
jgi:hypothetical protein